MDEKPPAFTVTDRRKFTFDGDLRDENAAASEKTETAGTSETDSTPKAAKVFSMPRREPEQAPEQTAEQSAAQAPKPVNESVSAQSAPRAEPVPMSAASPEDAEDSQAPPITAEESAEQHAAYQASSRQLDDMLKQANPGMQAGAPVSFDHVVQSIYLSAMIAMGAGTEQGQKPRIDILGARQSIDMLSVLREKTRGNLSEHEQMLLQSAIFELRMMFLEITNAISKAAHQPPPGLK